MEKPTIRLLKMLEDITVRLSEEFEYFSALGLMDNYFDIWGQLLILYKRLKETG
jgi:hypothetical protein